MIVPQLREALVKRAIAQDLPSTQPVFKDKHDIVCSSNHRGPLGQPGCGCLRRLKHALEDAIVYSKKE